VSALGSAFPERVARAVRDHSDGLAPLRDVVERFPRHAALKLVVARRGVPMPPDVRAPLRRLTPDEERALFDALVPWLE
jgi:dihydrodipicolinate synthase/N-acetylneuraminate lyase